jgi:excisionase family DNA binding protein
MRPPHETKDKGSPRPNGQIRNDLITVSEAARLLCVSRRTVERMVGRGQLPFYTLPVRGGLRFARQEILDWLEQRHQPLLE